MFAIGLFQAKTSGQISRLTLRQTKFIDSQFATPVWCTNTYNILVIRANRSVCTDACTSLRIAKIKVGFRPLFVRCTSYWLAIIEWLGLELQLLVVAHHRPPGSKAVVLLKPTFEMYKDQDGSQVLGLSSYGSIPTLWNIWTFFYPAILVDVTMCFHYTTTTKYAKAPCNSNCTVEKTRTEQCQDVKEGRPCKGSETSTAGSTTKRENCPEHRTACKFTLNKYETNLMMVGERRRSYWEIDLWNRSRWVLWKMLWILWNCRGITTDHYQYYWSIEIKFNLLLSLNGT